MLATCDTDATRKKEGSSRFFVALHGFCGRNSPHCSGEGGKQYAAIKHGARVFPAFTPFPSRARVRRFRGITASTRSPILHPAPAVSGETGIPNAFPPFRAHGNHRRIRCCNRLGEGGAGGEALLRKGPFFPQLPLSADAYEASPSAPRLCPQWRTIQNSRGGVGKRHVFGTRFPV